MTLYVTSAYVYMLEDLPKSFFKYLDIYFVFFYCRNDKNKFPFAKTDRCRHSLPLFHTVWPVTKMRTTADMPALSLLLLHSFITYSHVQVKQRDDSLNVKKANVISICSQRWGQSWSPFSSSGFQGNMSGILKKKSKAPIIITFGVIRLTRNNCHGV